jgi:solute carrier family 34 (sodium-dependent phosphate cotransporter)
MAIPMIMGANMGTTITNTIVSLGHIRNGEEFRRAFAAATIHDFFNLLSFLIFLPLEIAFGFLEKLSGMVVGFFTLSTGGQDFGFFNPIRWATDPLIDALGKDGLAGVFGIAGPFLMIFGGIAMIFGTIILISKLLKRVLIGTAEKLFHQAIGRGPLSGIASGAIITFLVQSSTTTTSLAVPLAGTGVLRINQVYPFTLGANIGTCITALLAAFAVDQEFLSFALQIALVHFLYNLIGVTLIYGVPLLRNIPLYCAEKLAFLSQQNKAYALGYLIVVFFVLPGLIWLIFGDS